MYCLKRLKAASYIKIQFSVTDLFSACFCRATRIKTGMYEMVFLKIQCEKTIIHHLDTKKRSNAEQKQCPSLSADDFYIEILGRN